MYYSSAMNTSLLCSWFIVILWLVCSHCVLGLLRSLWLVCRRRVLVYCDSAASMSSLCTWCIAILWRMRRCYVLRVLCFGVVLLIVLKPLRL